MIYGHGDDLYKYEGLVKANFSSNIYQNADLGPLKKHLAMRLDVVGNYPEPAPLSLEKAIAGEQGVSEEEVTVTNGATEAIYIIAAGIARRYGTDGAVNIIQRPTFSEYADACRMNGLSIANDGNLATGRKVYWTCNPNNPTGSVTPASELLGMADSRPDDLFVIDQSYEHYTLEPMIADRDAVSRNNIILLHSMTKRFCVPGLRLGYAIANRGLSRRLKRLRHPWSVNALAIEAGLFMINNRLSVIPAIDGYLNETRRLRNGLDSIDEVSVLDTKTNFMLASISVGDATKLKEFLAVRHGLLIRDASNFNGLDKSYFRVAAQGVAEDDMLVAAVKDFIAAQKRQQCSSL